ncbi:MAG TPA: efflux RND transporter periplasmic adaptor subunit, partial [Planctomycetaceae bacterium]|nr:efflux RND transporter periplasmic adaptor subunit [Planctomycetaceae bacterium]
MVDSTTSSRPSAIRRWLPFSLKLMAAVALSSGAVYWRWMAPISVESIQVEQADIVSEVMGTGTLEARLKAIISSRISGRIVEVSADLGDKIATGDPLIRLDDGELKQQVEMAKVSVSAAKAALDRFQADKSQAAAVLVQAENDHARIQKLFQSKAASAADLDKSREQVDIATAGISRADAAMVEAQHLELVAQSTLAYHEARLADTVIVAPFSGLIVQRYRDPGSITVPGSPVLSLISIDELWITAWVDETEMSHLAAGQKSRVIFRSEPAKSFPGEVARLGREADRETREFTVDVRVLEL